MDGRGGCCIARYAGGHAAAYDMSKMDRIMLKYRPIAPKPSSTANEAAAVSSDGGGKTAASGGGGRGRKKSGGSNSSGSGSGGGTRRKRKSCSPPDQKSVSEPAPPDYCLSNEAEGACASVTLPLLPESPDLGPTKVDQKMPMWPTTQPQARPQAQVGVVESCVVVEGITDTWTDQIEARNTRKSLERDTCPGFVSDAWNRVWWTNEAYRRMVMGEQDHDTWREEVKMVVWVAMREKIPENLEAFTCRVRVQQSYDGKEMRGSSLTVPCDVWRIDGGGFAWRLDVEAALSLGLGR